MNFDQETRKLAADWLRDCAHDAGTSDTSVGIFSNEDLAALFTHLAVEVECGDRPKLPSASPSEADGELLWAARDVVKWLDSKEVFDTFKQAGSLSVSHPHLAVAISKEFSVWASVVLKRFRDAVAAAPSAPLQQGDKT